MARQTTSYSNAQIDGLKDDIAELREMVKEHKIALTGQGSNPGLVGNLNALCTRVSALEQMMQNDFAHLQATIDVRLEGIMNTLNLQLQQRDMLKLVSDKDVITGNQVLKEWIKPIVVTILTAILSYFIFTGGLSR